MEKKPNIFVYKSPAHWINPDGVIKNVDTNHITVVSKDPAWFGLTIGEIDAEFEKTGEGRYIEGIARARIIKRLIANGYIRTRLYEREGRWTVNSRDREEQREILARWAQEMLAEGRSPHQQVRLDLPTGARIFKLGDLSGGPQEAVQ